MTIGSKVWVIPEGYIPANEDGETDRRFISHEAACILNANDQDADVAITLYFVDREPVGPYQVTVPAQRVLHLRFNDLDEPERVPRNTDYASVFVSNREVVVQHTRLDSRRGHLGLLSTIAYPSEAGHA